MREAFAKEEAGARLTACGRGGSPAVALGGVGALRGEVAAAVAVVASLRSPDTRQVWDVSSSLQERYESVNPP